MRKMLCLFILGLLTTTSFNTQAVEPKKDQLGKYQDDRFKTSKKPANLWHEIPFFPGGDIGQYTTTMSQNRDEVRKMFWQELMGEVQKLAESGAAVEAMIEPMANILLKFDQLHDIHKAKDVVNIDYSLEHQFKASLDNYFSKFDVRDHQRKIQISKGTDADLLSAYIREMSAERPFGTKISKEELNIKKALELFDQIDYVSFGTFSSLGRGKFQLTFHIIGYRNGVTRNFIARGELVEALDDLAKQVFDFFQANIYEEWKAPYSSLVWLPMPINPERQVRIDRDHQYDLYSFNEAKSYCQARGYRLPYAKEILMAETGTKYQEGGITSLMPYANWAVADRRQSNENHWLTPAISNSTNGMINGEGSLPLKGVFWCVRGTPAKDVALIDKLWSLSRKFRYKNLDAFRAIETIRFEIGDYGATATQMQFWNGTFVDITIFDDIDEALDVLKRNGIVIDFPVQN